MRLPTSRRGRLAVAIALAAGVALAVTELVPALPKQDLDLQVDLQVSSGSSVVLYYNEAEAQTQRIQAGRRTQYDFDGPSGDLRRLRLEVRDATGADIVVYAIRAIDEDDNVVAIARPSDFARSWFPELLTKTSATARIYAVRATGSPASLGSFWVVKSPSALPGPLEEVVQALTDPTRRFHILLVSLALGAALFSLLSARVRPAAATALVAAPTLVLALELVLSHPSGVTPASEALGRSTYFNLSLPTSVRAIWTIYAVGLLVAVAGALVATRWLRRSNDPPEPEQKRVGGRRAADVAALTVVALAALAYFVPDLRQVLPGEATWYYPGWDAENILAWNEFSSRGFVAMKDFWYPYGNFSLFQAAMLKGAIALALYELVLLAGYAWVFWIAAERRVVPASAATLGLLVAQPIAYEFRRYGLGLLIALAYACIDQRDQRIREHGRLVFAALATLGLFLDPALVVYAAFGVAALIAVDLVKGWRLGRRWWARRLAADFALPSIGLILVAAVLLARGQLSSFVELYTSLGLHAVYSAEPTVLMDGLGTALDLTTIVVWIPPVLFALGLFIRFVDDRVPSGYMLGSALIVTGAVAFPLLLKHSLRTIAPQLQLIPVVATILLLLWASRWPAAWYPIGALSGLAIAVALGFNGPDRALGGIRELPDRVYEDAKILLVDREARNRARAARFADDRYAFFPDEVKVARALRKRPEPRDDTDVYVLGDAPVIYSLLRQRPPWQIVLFNASPLEEQRRAIRWLEEEAPRYVVFDRLNPEFDGVPQAVRTPLIFQYVIGHYEFVYRTGAYDVLRRSESVDLSQQYWPRVLAGQVNLGRTPEVSSYDEIEPCNDGAPDCGVFLVARSPQSGWSGRVDIPVEFNGHPIVVRFRPSGSERYVIPLARTWAWGLSHSPKLAASPTKGWRAELVRGRQPEDVLY